VSKLPSLFILSKFRKTYQKENLLVNFFKKEKEKGGDQQLCRGSTIFIFYLFKKSRT
jgi:hypothetical protein